MRWWSYIAQRGTLHAGMRLEVHTAQLQALIAQVAGNKKEDGSAYTPRDFMLHTEVEVEDTLSFDDAVVALQRIGHGP